MIKNILLHATPIFTIGFLLFSIFLLVSAYFAYQSEQRLASWGKTEATIHESEIRQTQEPCGATNSGGCVGLVWDLHLVYTYTVDGKTYTGTELSNSLSKKDANGPIPAELQAIHEQLKPGSTTAAWYNPNKPERAYLFLDRNASRSFLIYGLILFGLFAASGLVYIKYIRG